MKISIVGTGYVGLVVGTCFANSGNDVVCIDKDNSKLDSLRSGEVPFYEPRLTELVERNIREERLEFTDDMEYGVQTSDIIFIAVGTPSDDEGSANLQYVLKVADNIGEYINDYKIVVDKSTVPVGTADKVEERIGGRTNHDFTVVSNPEFLKEGSAVNDFLFPDRIIIGTKSKRAAETLKELYSPFVRTGNPVYVMDVRSAEMAKYAANSFLALKISFMNELANLTEEVDANIDDIRLALGSDTRIGKKFLFPGVGYGGSCFPKDVKALIQMGEEEGIDLKINRAAYDVNERQKTRIFHKVNRYFDGKLSDKRITIWGLSFKPKTDDMRNAPSVSLINKLLEADAEIVAYDPIAVENAKDIFGDSIEYSNNLYASTDNSDALVLVTEWDEFYDPDMKRIKSNMDTEVIFDGRNQYDPYKIEGLGFDYFCVGYRKTSKFSEDD